MLLYDRTLSLYDDTLSLYDDTLLYDEFDISQVTLQNLLEQKLNISEIAKMQVVSERTVYRRMAQFSLSKYNFSSICDEVLDFTMSEIEKIFPLLSKRE